MMTNQRSTVACCVLASSCMAGVADAMPAFTLLTDDRGVLAASQTTATDRLEVTETALFGMDADITANANYSGPGMSSEAGGLATQISSFSPGALQASLMTTAIAEFGGQFVGVQGRSYVDITFSIDQQTDFQISAVVMLGGPFSSFSLFIETDEPAPTSIISWVAGGDFSGTLDAGAYRLRYELITSGAGDIFFESSEADVAFALVPSPGAAVLLAPIGLTSMRRRRR